MQCFLLHYQAAATMANFKKRPSHSSGLRGSSGSGNSVGSGREVRVMGWSKEDWEMCWGRQRVVIDSKVTTNIMCTLQALPCLLGPTQTSNSQRMGAKVPKRPTGQQGSYLEVRKQKLFYFEAT